MIATTDQKARVFDLWASVSELVRDGKRDPEAVAGLLQAVKDQEDFLRKLIGNPLVEWHAFFADRHMFDMDADFAGIVCPAYQYKYPWVIVVPKGLGYRFLLDVCRKNFSTF